MQQLLLIVHVLVAISLIALVLLQHGKGADAGAAFGSGASNTMFGSTGATPFLVKITAILAAIFFVTSLILSYTASKQIARSDVLNLSSVTVPAIPVIAKVPASKKEVA